MVFIMVAVSSIFFLAADQVIRIVVTFILGIKA
jgi:preprotein translocase subunit SecE